MISSKNGEHANQKKIFQKDVIAWLSRLQTENTMFLADFNLLCWKEGEPLVQFHICFFFGRSVKQNKIKKKKNF